MNGFTPVRVDETETVAPLFAHLSQGSAWKPSDIAILQPPRGFVLSDDARATSLALVSLAADEAELVEIGILTAARRGGLGYALLAAVLAKAVDHGAKRLVLEVATDNGPARALYAKAGFAQVGRRPAYYDQETGRPADALILARSLVLG
ncbi:MAG: GNAT family N-acetyltransferase [Pseudomonadota bacterium]